MTLRRRRRRSDDDFAAEIEAHLESEAARLVGEGLTEDEARSRARRNFGNVTRARERFHERQHFVWPGQLAQDLRYAWRGLWYSRAFLATTVLTLAVGMSLVSVVFGVFNAYVLRPFAVHDPYSLYAVGWRSQEAAGSGFRMQDYEDLQGRSDIFDGVIAETPRSVVSNNRALAVGFVSGNYFAMLGVRMRLGRGFAPSDAAVPGSEAVAVLSEQAWTTLFDRDPLILGRTIDLGGQDLVIIGVASGTFAGLDQAPKDAWVPITMYGPLGGGDLFAAPQKRQVQITARLRHDRVAQEAQTSLAFEPFETRVSGRLDAVRATLQQRATPVRMSASGYALLSPVFAAFGLVLLAACANASNVMLARANARHREIGIRLSIGASRGRVVRQLLTEGFLISVLAAGLGLVLAQVFLRVGVFAFLEMLPADHREPRPHRPARSRYSRPQLCGCRRCRRHHPFRLASGAASDPLVADRRLTRPHRCRRPQFDAAVPPRHLPGGCITRARPRCRDTRPERRRHPSHGSGHGHRSRRFGATGTWRQDLARSNARGTCCRSSIGSGGGGEQEPSLRRATTDTPQAANRHRAFGLYLRLARIFSNSEYSDRARPRLLERGITNRGIRRHHQRRRREGAMARRRTDRTNDQALHRTANRASDRRDRADVAPRRRRRSAGDRLHHHRRRQGCRERLRLPGDRYVARLSADERDRVARPGVACSTRRGNIDGQPEGRVAGRPQRPAGVSTYCPSTRWWRCRCSRCARHPGLARC